MAGLARRLAPAAALGGLAMIIVGVADPALAGRTRRDRDRCCAGADDGHDRGLRHRDGGLHDRAGLDGHVGHAEHDDDVRERRARSPATPS